MPHENQRPPLKGNVINFTGDTEIAPTGYLVSKRRGDLRIARPE